jgi:hypothetical protein
MKFPLLVASLLAAAAAHPKLTPTRPPAPGESYFKVNVTGFITASFSGTGPSSSAKRRAKVGSQGEILAIKLRTKSDAFGEIDLDATPEVTGKPPLGETGRYSLANLGATGTITHGKEKRWINAKTGDLVLDECDEKHVKGRFDFKGPCRNGPEQGICSVHADFDVSREK